jgi:uncharacterized SAM-binding protein YcdF (DUF218 family)
LKTLFSFPFIIIGSLACVLVALHYQRIRLVKMLIISIALSLYLMCTPLMMQLIFAVIGRYPPLSIQQIQQQHTAQAIVILGGGLYIGQEYANQKRAGFASLARIHYGAYVAKATDLPIVLSGIEAEAMLSSLRELGLGALFVEDKSLDTHQNAQFSAQLLQSQGIKNIVLVTDAWHMSRSVLAFEHFGFRVLAAPTEFPEGFFINPQALLQPTAMMFSANLRGLAEVLGHVKYRVRYWLN